MLRLQAVPLITVLHQPSAFRGWMSHVPPSCRQMQQPSSQWQVLSLASTCRRELPRMSAPRRRLAQTGSRMLAQQRAGGAMSCVSRLCGHLCLLTRVPARQGEPLGLEGRSGAGQVLEAL